MIKKTFEKYNLHNQLIDRKTYDAKSTWEDLTLKEFIAYNEVLNDMNKYIEKYGKGMIEDSPEEHELKKTIYFADMLVALTGMPRDIIYTMNAKQIDELFVELDFSLDKLPTGQTDTFFFRTHTLQEIELKEKEYSDVSRFKMSKRIKIKAELELMKKSKFQLKGSCDDMTLEKWISTRGILKEVKSIQADFKNNEFKKYALLIAYLVEQNGKVLSIAECKKLAKVFEDLPFCTAYQVVSFFLNVQNVLLNKTSEYLKMMTLMVSQRQQQKSNL